MTPAGPGMAHAGPGMTPAGEVLDLLRVLGQSVATAESLTGGLVCAALTDVPGSSAVVRGAVVSYAVEVKEQVLGVPADVLAQHGAVSRECAEAMARGVRAVVGADWGVATTGVAGPEPSEGKAVGTVHVAVCGPGALEAGPDADAREQRTAHRVLHLDGSRTQIREQTVAAALELLRDTLGRGLSGGDGTVGHHPAGAPDETD